MKEKSLIMIYKDITHTIFSDIQTSSHSDFNHEKVFYYEDAKVGLKSLIAVHDTTKGPGIGGCRYKPYRSYAEGLTDVLRLSKGMTEKNIAANIPFGGGKAIIFSENRKSKKMLESFANFLNLLDGMYISAQDIGISYEDIKFIRKFTPYVFDNADPGPYTAKGIFYSIEAAIKFYYQSDLVGRKISIQGAGSVGLNLAYHLSNSGAIVYIQDIDTKKVQSITSKNIIPVKNALIEECDLFAPCAVGGILNDLSINELKCKIIAGGANNQLSNKTIDTKLYHLGINYIPDVLINSGGVIGLTKDYLNKNDLEIENDLVAIADRALEYMKIAKKESKTVLDAMGGLFFKG